MTPPTERVTPKEREWLEQVAIESGVACDCGQIDPDWTAKKAGPRYNTESGHAMNCLLYYSLAALVEVLTKTKEACAKRQAGTRHMMVVMAQNRDGMLTIPEIETVFDDQPIRNLEITGE